MRNAREPEVGPVGVVRGKFRRQVFVCQPKKPPGHACGMGRTLESVREIARRKRAGAAEQRGQRSFDLIGARPRAAHVKGGLISENCDFRRAVPVRCQELFPFFIGAIVRAEKPEPAPIRLRTA